MEKVFTPLNYLLSIVILVGLVACDDKIEPSTVQNLDTWEIQYQKKWLKAEVPGNNYSDLLKHNVIPDPFWGANENSVQWVKDSTWTYRCIFNPDENLWIQKHKELHFEGLDTYADIYLNDSLILQADNQFRSWKIDVSEILKKEENSLLAVFHPVQYKEGEKHEKLEYELAGGSRVHTRKAAFNYGWDWSPQLISSGIWRPVSLIGWSGIRLTNLYIEQLDINQDQANLIAHFSYESGLDSEYTFSIANESKEAHVKKGKSIVSVPFTIENPRLWWPQGQGEQKLYELSGLIAKEGELIDENSQKIGLRKIELVTEKDSLGESFQFRINGRDIFMKGANYVPQDNLQNRVKKGDYQKLLQSTIDANMNMLRVWGGGIYEEDIFYELCDSLGVLVWQDFMFACAMYPGDQAFLENVEQEAIENVKRLRNHPSIALWCGNNENSEGWHRWGWQDPLTEEQQDEVWTAYQNVFMDILPQAVQEYSNTPYWESSPMLGRGDPKHQFSGDAHYWGVWHDAEPFEVLEEKVPRFMSEFGFLSFPSMETLDSISNKEDQYLSSLAMQNHVKHTRGLSLIKEYLERDYAIPEDFEKFVIINQVMQAEGISLGLKAHRRAKGYCMGTLYWQLNDCWPAASWSSIDYYGRWKAMHYLAKRAYSPILISTEQKANEDLLIYLVSDINENLTDTLESVLINMVGDTLWSIEESITLIAQEAKIVNEVPSSILNTLDLATTVLVNRLKTSNQREVYFFKSPKELTLQEPKFKIEFVQAAEGSIITIQSDVVAKNVYIHGIDAHFSDNYFDLLPGETKQIEVSNGNKQVQELKIRSLFDLLNR